MEKFKQWLEEKSWSADRKSVKDGTKNYARCRRCGESYAIGNFSDFFDGATRCPKCGGQGDLEDENKKLQGIPIDSSSRRRYGRL